MKLYRLQTSDWDGPWRGPQDLSRYFELRCTGKTHPAPWMDGLNAWYGGADFLFASPSLEYLKEWFDPYAGSTDSHEQWMRQEDIKELKANGFQVYVLEVSGQHFRIGNSGRQVSFLKDCARKVEVLPLELLFNTVASV